MTALDDERFPTDVTRELQEHEIALAHGLSDVEHALANEACGLSLVFEEAGIEFDPLTSVALRVVNECFETQVDPVAVLVEFRDRGVLGRAVELANETRLGDATS